MTNEGIAGSAMAGWYVDIRHKSGTKSVKNASFAEVKNLVVAREPGETVIFMPPIAAPRAEIDELVRLGGRKTVPQGGARGGRQ
jgi:adenosylmethionine-8-amino-7-oxononanoate aminotransferase